MKKITYIMISILWVAFACQSEKEGFVINGEIRGDTEDKKVYLTTLYDVPSIILDSARIRNGKFQFSGKLDYPQRYKIVVDNNSHNQQGDERGFLESFFYVENAPITYIAHIDSMPTRYYFPERKVAMPIVKGSMSEDLYQMYVRETKDLNFKYDSLYQEYIDQYHKPTINNIFNTSLGVTLAKQIKAVSKEKKDRSFSFVKKYSESVVALNIAREFVENMFVEVTNEEIDVLLADLKPKWQGTKPFQIVDSLASLARVVALGSSYPDMLVMNKEDEKVMLSSLIKSGEYTMLEFWASWCAPCRGEIPHLKQIYKEYKDKKFNILSISIDENKADWEKALKDEGMGWIQAYDTAGFNSEIVRKYRIMGVPTSFIISPSGKIVEVNTRGAFLDLFLEEIGLK